MKKFEEPNLNVEMLTLEDVITTSQTCEDDGCGEYECDWDTGGFSLR